MNYKRLSFLFFPLLLIILFVFWWTTKSIPYWWDSAGFVITGAKIVLKHKFLILDLGLPGAYPHTTFFVVLLALMWKMFGESFLVSHLLMLFFTVLLFVYMFRLTQLLTGSKWRGNLVAFLAGILLLFTPVFFAQLGIIYMEIPITAFAVMSVYYYLRRNIPLYLLSTILMVYTKDVSVFLILVILAFDIGIQLVHSVSVDKKIDIKDFLNRIVLIGLPIFILFLWFLYHKMTTGWWYIPPSAPWAGPKAIVPENIQQVLSFVFADQWRIIPTILILIFLEESFIRKKYQKDIFKSDFFLILLIPFATALFFGMTEFLQRYIIIGLPFFYILFYYLFTILLQKKTLRFQLISLSLITVIICSLFYSQWNLHRKIVFWHFPPLEENLEYKDVISVGEAISSYLEKNYPNAKILTSFPADYMFSQPFQGYVKKPLRSKNCNKIKPGDKYDFVIFHPFSPISIYCLQIIERDKLKPIKNFERNGKFMSIYGH